ncbi:MAG: tetratricopeptide repeat protein [Lutibacter sp.]
MLLDSFKVCCFFAIIPFITFAQKTDLPKSNDYQEGIQLYNNNLYLAAQEKFKQVISKSNLNDDNYENASYYYAYSAIKLNQPKADELMQNFVKSYPTNSLRNTAFIDVGNFYFNQAKYAYAAKWYSKVNTNNLTTSELNDFNFNFGYTLFATKHYEKAESYLIPLFTSQKYGARAKYYVGYMAYQKDQFTTAEKYLSDVETNTLFKNKVPYYLADMNFKLGKFNKAITYAKPMLAKAKGLEKSELNKIIGESYFNLKDYVNALKYLKNYRGNRGKWTNTDYYQLGYTYFKLKSYHKAISYFNKIIGGNNAVAQNAYYALGDCYLQLNQKSEALLAFKNAAQLNFNPAIKENAFYQYSKLSFEIGNPYLSKALVLNQFLNDFPKSKYKTEIQHLLVDAYIETKNYKQGLNFIKKNKLQLPQSKIQQINLDYGFQLFSQNYTEEAITFFNKAIQINANNSISNQAYFGKAECQYHLKRYDEALTSYSKISNSDTINLFNLNYQKGYAYLKLGNYEKAIEHFKLFINTDIENKWKNDAYLRIADSYFASKKYKLAILNYKKSISLNSKYKDYAYLQTAHSYGLIGESANKIKTLQSFLNLHLRSIYNDDAWFLLGRTYLKQNNYKDAINCFNEVNDHFKRSSFAASSLLNKGLIYYNSNNNEEAISTYKLLVAQYPKSKEALQAIKNAKQIYIETGKVNEYANWVKKLSIVSVEESELDDATYASAEKQFIANHIKKAITGFENYLKKYPNGLHSLPANFYLGELYVKDNKNDHAKITFKRILDENENEFTEKALANLSLIYLKENNWLLAQPLLSKLEKIATNSDNLDYAKLNLMKSYFELKQYEKAEKFAKILIQSYKRNIKIKNDAQLILARSAIRNKNFNQAKESYSFLENSSNNAIKVEALYYKSFFENSNKQFQESNNTIKKIVKTYASYKQWVAKSLLIMAANYHQLNDAFQAAYILENIIKNFSDYPEITNQAKSDLKEIKKEQAKTNQSVKVN